MRPFCSLLLPLSTLLLLGGCAEQNEYQAPPPPPVKLELPYNGPVTVYSPQTGQTHARDAVEVRARVRGFLETVEFAPGTFVEKGALLFTIEPELYEADLQSAEGKLESAIASRDLADTTYRRNEQLFTSDAISELDLLRSKSELDLAAASVTQAEASVNAAALDLSYTELHAPISGRISRELVTAGNLVGSGDSTLLATILQMDPMDVYINIDERTLLGYLTLNGQNSGKNREPVTAKLELADGTVYDQEGVIDYYGNTVDALTGTIEARVSFPNAEGKLIPGLYAKVLFSEEIPDAIVVPDSCIMRNLQGDYVLVVDGQNIVETRPIEKGPLIEKGRIVLKGLEADERVIVEGIQRARPGMPVTPTN